MSRHTWLAATLLAAAIQCVGGSIQKDATSTLMVQYGKPRTATTLQFMTLCASTCLLHGKGECVFDPRGERMCNKWVPSEGPLVCKTHTISNYRPMQFDSKHKYLFVTQNNNKTSGHKIDRKFVKESNVAYAAIASNLGNKDDPLLLHDYAKVLGLKGTQVDDLNRFLTLWDKLRVCCGAQMSNEYRRRLVKSNSSKKSNLQTVPANNTKTSNKCEEYNIAEVEQALLATKIFKTCGYQIKLMHELSNRDGELDGTYCTRSTAAAIKHGFIFNDHRYKNPTTW
eukprot:gene15504-32885_t